MFPKFPMFEFDQCNRGSFESVYKAMQSKDLADCVVAALQEIKESNGFTEFKFKEKSNWESHEKRLEGDRNFEAGDYLMALKDYNLALMLAPPNSNAMLLACNSRAILLFKTKRFSSCLKDIETCLTLNCSDLLAGSLQDLKQKASKMILEEELSSEPIYSCFVDQFFELRDQNPDLPCASADVEVIMESHKPKVVAAKDIPVGTVIAIETSFVSAPNVMNKFFACSYCNKMSLNLIPCDGCCAALFCDTDCKERALEEGHNVECKMDNIFIAFDEIELPVKAIIKMRQKTRSWNEFISASSTLGVDRMKNISSTSDIFNSELSLLNAHKDTHFIYGAMFNKSINFAHIIHYLDTKTSFLPNSADEKNAAIRAISRILMHLSLYCTKVKLEACCSVGSEEECTWHKYPNHGYFPFIGNLTHSCEPNTFEVGIRNRAALVTLIPIKKGTEVTISYNSHWLEVDEENMKKYAFQSLLLYRTVCSNCIICRGDKILRNQVLNEDQKRAYSIFKLDLKFSSGAQEIYTKTCKALHLLSEVPYSKEYRDVFCAFTICIMQIVNVQYPNVMLNRLEQKKTLILIDLINMLGNVI